MKMIKIKEKIINKKFSLNALYLNENQQILNAVTELATELFNENYDENIIKIVSCNKVLKK